MQKKQILIRIVFLALIAAGCSGPGTTVTAPDQASDVVFKTPEEAITSYLEGVAQNDVRKIAQACAINEMSEGFRFDLYADKTFLPADSLSPTNSPVYVEINKMQVSGQFFKGVKIFAYSLLSSEMVYDRSALPGLVKMDTERINRFMKDVDPKRLANLRVTQIGLPDKTRMNSASYLKNAANIALTYGADESTERVALFSFEQNYYYLGFTLLRYGENWKISDLRSALADILYRTGVLQKTTVEKFGDMISGN